MATFSRRGNRWQAIIRRKGHRPLYRTFPLKRDAEVWAREIEGRIHEGSYRSLRASERMTVSELCTWYEETVTPAHAPGATDRYRLATIRGQLGHWTAAAIKPEDVVEFSRQRLRAGRAPATVRRELQQLSDVWNSARALRGIALPANPIPVAVAIMRKLRVLKPSTERTRRLRSGELEALLSARPRACRWIQPMVEFALETAMRRGEISRIRRKDVRDSTLRIYRSKTDWQTGRVGRTIPLSPRAREILRKLPKRRDGRYWPVEDEHSITRAFERLCALAKIKGLRFHDLRHEATSRLFEKGLSMMEVASITGHRDINMLKRYTHPDPGRLAEKL